LQSIILMITVLMTVMLGLEVATYIVHWQFKLCIACSGAACHW